MLRLTILVEAGSAEAMMIPKAHPDLEAQEQRWSALKRRKVIGKVAHLGARDLHALLHLLQCKLPVGFGLQLGGRKLVLLLWFTIDPSVPMKKICPYVTALSVYPPCPASSRSSAPGCLPR